MAKRSNCLERAGHVLILTIWVEKRLIDFIVLKKHPRLIKKVNNSSSKVPLPHTFVKERTKLWEDNFPKILKDFLQVYEVSDSFKNNLEAVSNWRDIIGHCYVSLYREYILYRPSSKRRDHKKRLGKFKKLYSLDKKVDAARPFQITMRLSDDKKYNRVLNVLNELDDVLFSNLAKNIGLDYEKIR